MKIFSLLFKRRRIRIALKGIHASKSIEELRITWVRLPFEIMLEDSVRDAKDKRKEALDDRNADSPQ